MILHKSRKYRAILDLLSLLRLTGYMLPSVNDATEHYAPDEAIDQIGTCIARIFSALATAPVEEGPVFIRNMDFKDRF